jgi:hypothetical protein
VASLVVLLAGALDEADVSPLLTIPIGLVYLVACLPAFFGLVGWSWMVSWCLTGFAIGGVLDRRSG